MPKVVLASQSPRRRELLKNIFPEFTVLPSDADETILEDLAPCDFVTELARRKVCDITARAEGALVIGADTVVVKDGKILGKPADTADAFNMLSMLSGSTHVVYTGLAVAYKGALVSAFEATEVTFRKLTDEMIFSYIATGEPMDKAGAYGIQERGALLVEKICGDYFNVVGLPLCRLSKLLSELEISTL